MGKGPYYTRQKLRGQFVAVMQSFYRDSQAVHTDLGVRNAGIGVVETSSQEKRRFCTEAGVPFWTCRHGSVVPNGESREYNALHCHQPIMLDVCMFVRAAKVLPCNTCNACMYAMPLDCITCHHGLIALCHVNCCNAS